MLSIHIQPFFLRSVSLVYATNELSFFFRSSSFTLSLASFIIVKVKNGLKRPVLLDLYQIQLKNATFSQKTLRNIWWNGIFAVLLHPLSRTPPRWLFERQQRQRSLKGLHRQRSSTRANFHIIYSVEDLGRTTVQFLEKKIFGSVLKTDNKRIE